MKRTVHQLQPQLPRKAFVWAVGVYYGEHERSAAPRGLEDLKDLYMAPDGTKTLREDQGDRKDPVAQEGKGRKVRESREGPGSPLSVTVLDG